MYILAYIFFQCFEEMSDQRYICIICSKNIEDTYNFRVKCLKSKTIYQDYLTQLNSESNNLNDVNMQVSETTDSDGIKKETETSLQETERSKNTFINFEQIKVESRKFL